MGMWDITCALTHLPIQDQDPIRFIFLRQPLFFDGIFKSWAQWVPTSLPLKGVYDSYGGIEGIEVDNVVRFQVDCFKRWAEWDEGREDGFQDVAEGFPNTIESLVRGCERGGLVLRLPYDSRPEKRKDDKRPPFKRVRTAPFIIHEEIYQHMIAEVDRDPPGIGSWRSRMERKGKPDRTKWLRQGVEWAGRADERESVAEILRKEGKEDLADELIGRAFSLFLHDDLGSNVMSNTPDMGVIGNEWDPSPDNWPTLFEFTEEDWAELSRRMFEFDALSYTMHEIRRCFYPALFTDQYYYPRNQFDASRLFAHYVDKMSREFQERHAEIHKDDEEDGE